MPEEEVPAERPPGERLPPVGAREGRDPAWSQPMSRSASTPYQALAASSTTSSVIVAAPGPAPPPGRRPIRGNATPPR